MNPAVATTRSQYPNTSRPRGRLLSPCPRRKYQLYQTLLRSSVWQHEGKARPAPWHTPRELLERIVLPDCTSRCWHGQIGRCWLDLPLSTAQPARSVLLEELHQDVQGILICCQPDSIYVAAGEAIPQVLLPGPEMLDQLHAHTPATRRKY